MFVSAHYGGEDLVLKFGEGEAWKKVFGPIFIYLNSSTNSQDPLSLWEDAKNQVILIKNFHIFLVLSSITCIPKIVMNMNIVLRSCSLNYDVMSHYSCNEINQEIILDTILLRLK